VRSVVWPSIGISEIVEQDEPSAGPDDVVIDVSISVLSPGTERALLLGLPTAAAEFPQFPGYMAAGSVRRARSMAAGTRVAVRRAGHRSVAVVPARFVRAVPEHVPLVDAAVWQLALTAMYGLALGEHRAGEPVTVIGAGLLGVITRRLATACGAPMVRVVASSEAKAWGARAEPVTTFLSTSQVSADSPLVLDVTGSADGLATAIAATADGGRVVLLGSPRTDIADVPLQQLYDRRLRIVGAHVTNLNAVEEPAFSDAFFDLLASGEFTVRDVLAEYPADDAPLVYRRLVTDRSFIGAALYWGPDYPPGGADRVAAATTTNEAAVENLPAKPVSAEHAIAASNAMALKQTQSYQSAPTVRFGLVGCGDIGIEDAKAVTAAAGVDLVACHDPVERLADDIAARFDAHAERHLATLLARHDVDAVIIATPHDTHEPITLAALDAGKHVLMEKPLAQDLVSAQRIAAAAAASPLKTGVLFPTRTDARFHQARAAIDAGLIGAPLGVAASYLVDKPPSYFYGGLSQRSPSSWRLSKARSGGGFLIMNLIHQLDTIRALLGIEADYVYADMAPSGVAQEIEDVVTVVVRFGATIATLVGGASVVGGGGQHLRLWGETGQVQVLPEYMISTRTQPPDPAQATAGSTHSSAVELRALAIARFATSVRDGTPVDVCMQNALAVQAIVEAAYESALLGRAMSPTSPIGGGRR
jgi:2-desacetyl-2-hydroxyethyl bacteriochlorophyllide A dehydrogenase